MRLNFLQEKRRNKNLPGHASREIFETRLFRFLEHLVSAAHVAVLFDVETVLERLFVLVGAVANALAFLALHLDSVVLGHNGVKKE